MAKKKKVLYIAIDRETKEVFQFRDWDTCQKFVSHRDFAYKGFAADELEEAEEFKRLNLLSMNEKELDTGIKDVMYAYVDGSRRTDAKNKCIAYSYGLCILQNKEIIHEECKAFSDENNKMFQIMGELKGALKAVEYCISKNAKKIYLVHDYAGVEYFATGLWNSESKAIQEYYEKMQDYMYMTDIQFVKVKSHVSDKTEVNIYNDRADELANQALKFSSEINDSEAKSTVKFKCSFTGHRPGYFPFGYDENDSRCIELKGKIASVVRQLVEKKNVKILNTGMALGWDMWTAEEVLKLKKEYPDIELHAYVPYDFPNLKWKDESINRYYEILGQCQKVEVVKDKAVKTQLLHRNRLLVDNANIIVAYFDKDADTYGTAYTINYARQSHKPIINIFSGKFEGNQNGK